jgi:hypothetical protein
VPSVTISELRKYVLIDAFDQARSNEPNENVVGRPS